MTTTLKIEEATVTHLPLETNPNTRDFDMNRNITYNHNLENH